MVEELYQSFRCITGLGDDVCGSCVGAVDIRRRDRSSTVGHSLDVCRGDGPHDGVSGGRRGGLTVATGCLHVALLSGASSAFTYSPSLAAVQEWFPRQLGLVTGLVNASFALPAAAAAPVVAAMLKHWGFTDTVVTLMIGVAVTQVLVIFLSTPHWLEKERRAGLAASREEISAPSATTAQAVRTHAFWQVWAIWFAGGGAAITMMTFAATYSAHLNDIGVRVSAVAAVTAFVSGKWADTSDQRDGARSCRTDGHRSRDFLDPCHGVRVVGFRHQWSGTHRGGFPGRSRFGDNLHDLALCY